MCTSSASTGRVKLPASRPRVRIASISSIAGEPSSRRSGSSARCSARWMFSIATRRMKSGCASWWSNVSSAIRRIAATGSRWSTSIACSLRADGRVRVLEHLGVEPFLALEVVVEHPLGGAGALGDLVDAGAGVAVLGELLRRDREDLGCASVRGRGCVRGRRGARRHAAESTFACVPRGRLITYWFVHYGRPTLPAPTRRLSVGLIGAGIGASLSPALHEHEAVLPRPRLRLPRARPRRARRRAARGIGDAARAGPRSRLRRAQRHPSVQAARARAPRRADRRSGRARRRQHRGAARRAGDRATTPTAPASPRASAAGCRARR